MDAKSIGQRCIHPTDLPPDPAPRGKRWRPYKISAIAASLPTQQDYSKRMTEHCRERFTSEHCHLRKIIVPLTFRSTSPPKRALLPVLTGYSLFAAPLGPKRRAYGGAGITPRATRVWRNKATVTRQISREPDKDQSRHYGPSRLEPPGPQSAVMVCGGPNDRAGATAAAAPEAGSDSTRWFAATPSRLDYALNSHPSAPIWARSMWPVLSNHEPAQSARSLST